MITSKAVIRTSEIKQSVSITIKTSKFKITGIKTNYMHTSGRKTYIGITPIIDLKSTPEDNELNFREYIDPKTLQTYLVRYNYQRYIESNGAYK